MELLTTVSAFVLQYALRVLGVGPLKHNKVLFFSYFGSRYSCNPKYLSEYLETHRPDFEIVWAFENPEEHRALEARGIAVVPFNTLQFVRACLTSRYVITNSELPAWLPVSRRQTLINTWHGGGAYKLVGAHYDKGSYWKNLRSAISRSKPCVYLSSSSAFTELTIRQSFQHKGEVIECGMPRNDLLVHFPNRPYDNAIDQRVREQLHIPPQNRVLLYAPTFREDRTASTYLFDFSAVEKALAMRFGGTWTILLRMHYLVMQQLTKCEAYIDASSYDDMQELLYVADVLITDYSSSIWDFGLTQKPCFLYAPDVSDYDAEHGFYSNIRTWPWSLSQSNDELVATISDFDNESFRQKLADHYKILGSKETGHACESVAKYLIDNRKL